MICDRLWHSLNTIWSNNLWPPPPNPSLTSSALTWCFCCAQCCKTEYWLWAPICFCYIAFRFFFLFKISLGISLILSRLYHCHQWSDLKLLPVDQKDIYVKCCPKERYRATLAHFRHFPPLSFIFVLYSTLHRFSYDKYHLYSEEQWWSQTPCCGCVSQWQDTQCSSSWVKDERSQMQSVTGLKVELTQI